MTSSRSARAGLAAAAVALAALGTASAAQAHTFFSVSGAVAPGVAVGVTNVPAPVYVQPAVTYPANSTEVWFPGTVQYAPAVVEYVQPGRRHREWERERRRREHGRWEHERREHEGHWGHDRD